MSLDTLDPEILKKLKHQVTPHTNELVQLVETLINQPVKVSQIDVVTGPLADCIDHCKMPAMLTRISWDGKKGGFILYNSIELAIVASAMMMGLPAKVISQKISVLDLDEELTEVYAEVANQFTGVINQFILNKLGGDIHLTLGQTDKRGKDAQALSDVPTDFPYVCIKAMVEIEGYKPVAMIWLATSNLIKDIYGISLGGDEPEVEERQSGEKEGLEAEGDVDDGVIKAKQIMDSGYPTIDITKMISEAYDLMRQSHVESLPILDQGKVVKIITLNNVETIRSIHFDAPGQEEREARLMCLSLANVAKDQKLISVGVNDSYKAVMQTLYQNNIQSVPVISHGGEFVGMITSLGLIEYFGNV